MASRGRKQFPPAAPLGEMSWWHASRLGSCCLLAARTIARRPAARFLTRRERDAVDGRLGLASYPRSGSTLFRLLMEARTGLATGSDAPRRAVIKSRRRRGYGADRSVVDRVAAAATAFIVRA